MLCLELGKSKFKKVIVNKLVLAATLHVGHLNSFRALVVELYGVSRGVAASLRRLSFLRAQRVVYVRACERALSLHVVCDTAAALELLGRAARCDRKWRDTYRSNPRQNHPSCSFPREHPPNRCTWHSAYVRVHCPRIRFEAACGDGN